MIGSSVNVNLRSVFTGLFYLFMIPGWSLRVFVFMTPDQFRSQYNVKYE